MLRITVCCIMAISRVRVAGPWVDEVSYLGMRIGPDYRFGRVVNGRRRGDVGCLIAAEAQQSGSHRT